MRRSKLFFRWLTAWLLLCMLGVGLLGGAGLSARAAPVQQTATNIVISEFRLHGSGGGTDEFIELYNPTGSVINIGNWKVKGSNDSGSVGTRYTFPVGIELQPNKYYLLANTGFDDIGIVPDATYSTGIANNGGIALTLANDTIIDQVGLSNGSAFKEGTPLAALTTNVDRGYERKLGGGDGNCIQTIDNSTEFQQVSPSNPQNSTSPAVACGIPPTPVIEVLINEVAWAGTQAFSGDEWIELYNPGSTDVVLDGWRLEAAGGNPSIVIPNPTAGDDYVIPAFGFFLLERGDDNVVLNVTANYIYGSSLLPDGGETLYLRRPDRSIVDTANLDGGGWPAGNQTTTATMQRGAIVTDSDFAWVTYYQAGDPLGGSDRDAANNPILGTPGRANQPPNVTATATFAPPTLTPTSTVTSTPTVTTTPPPGNVRSIVINEVAWAGTRASADDEWIELYNPGTAAINLAGWVLKSSDGSPTIELPNVNLAAGAYFLLERTDDNTVADITADLIYTGSLTNSGEILYLYDPADRIIDTANSTLPIFWPAGNPSDYSSMQRSVIAADSNFVWVTYDVTKDLPANYAHDAAGDPIRGTPRRANLPINVTATPTRVSTTTGGSSGGSTGGIATPAPVIGISEFLPRPGHDWNNDGRVDVFDEFIEIINAGRGDINLSAYRLDDEQIGGSVPYTLPNQVLKPDERAVFYASETGILLSDAGDTVRLLRGNTVIDAYTYPVVRYPDQSWCRIPDRLGYWNDPCFPTPNNANALTGRIPLPSGGPTGYRPPVCLLPDTAPDEFIYAECEVGGDGIWNRQFWDGADAGKLLTLGEVQKWETVFE